MSVRRAVPAASLLALLLAVGATGCASTVAMERADAGTDPGCAEVVVRLPDVLGEGTDAAVAERPTDAQGTGAWGDPAAVLLTCGVTPPGPTTQSCVDVNGVDWIEDDSDAPYYRFTTYGREPAVEVYLDSDAVSGSTVLADLSSSVSVLPQEAECLGAEDLLGGS